MKSLINIVLTSLKTRSEEPATDGLGDLLQNELQRQSEEKDYVPNVRQYSLAKKESSTTLTQSLSQCGVSGDGTNIVHDCSLVHQAGKSCALLATEKRQEEKTNVGKKYDSEKPALAYIPKAALEAEGRAFSYGAQKYNPFNYKNGIAVTRTLSATMRHIIQFLAGEDFDRESGVHHLGCARANLAMALDTLENHPEMDDRFKGDK
jgi:hypothetical protein